MLCGAQIIDLIVLVIDGTKGIQAQTAECLIVAEIMTDRLIFVVNKVDLWTEEERMHKFEGFEKKLRTVLKDEKFSNCPIIPFSANLNIGVNELKSGIDLCLNIKPLIRPINDDFVFAVDHCFPIKGQGTVLTGTVLQGQISVNETIEIPHLKLARKIKSIQSFRENVKKICAGDRAGICVQSVESDLIERTLICVNGSVIPCRSVILLKAKRVKYFKGQLLSKMKIHISILNEVVLCKQIIFVRPTDFGFEYLDSIPQEMMDEFLVLIELEKPVNILPGSIVIGSKLDSDPLLQRCRISFYGKWEFNDFSFDKYKIYRMKQYLSPVDRIVSDDRLIGQSFSSSRDKKYKSSHKYIGMKVKIYKKDDPNLLVSTGIIDSLFGSNDKFNVTLDKKVIFGAQDLIIQLSFGKVLFNEKEKMVYIF